MESLIIVNKWYEKDDTKRKKENMSESLEKKILITIFGICKV